MRELKSDKAGKIVRDVNGYDIFVPHKLMEQLPMLNIDFEMLNLNGEAERELGKLNGLAKRINPDLFISSYITKEALLSSQIEGTQSTIVEVMQLEDGDDEYLPAFEVINYIKALNLGLRQIKDLASIPVSENLIHKIHNQLLIGVRGDNKQPGQYKTYQNMIGNPGCTLKEAEFIPPSPALVSDLMNDWFKFYHEEDNFPPLIKAAILHYQFETIHPYTDGNGRIGRLMITFMLCEKKILEEPLLYISLFFKEFKARYYELLMNVRLNGDWEEWIKFFLRGIRNTSQDAIKNLQEIIDLQEDNRKFVRENLAKYSLAPALFDLICKKPVISIKKASKELDAHYTSVQYTFKQFINAGILTPMNVQRKRDRLYAYEKYLEILNKNTQN